MIRKINLISFIFLFIFLIGTVSATTIENETQTINNDLEISDDENIQAIDNIETAYKLSKKYNVEMPIVDSVYNILFNKLTPEEAVFKLMTREAKQED